MSWLISSLTFFENTKHRFCMLLNVHVLAKAKAKQCLNARLTHQVTPMKAIVKGLTAVLFVTMAPPSWGQTLHTPFSELLASHVKPTDDGFSTQVDYSGLALEKVKLYQYLSSLAAIDKDEFDEWSQPKQLAFLINAYNGYTLALILEHYGEIESIRDVGGFFSSPWKQKIAPLLGEIYTLDDIEHTLIRKDDRYNEPRIHFAVNCASVGCPSLRQEAYTEDALESQLDEQTRLFLADQSRNDITDKVLYLSKIFDWYHEDFEKGFQGAHSVQAFIALHANTLSLTPLQVKKLANDAFEVKYTEYNWALNDTK